MGWNDMLNACDNLPSCYLGHIKSCEIEVSYCTQVVKIFPAMVYILYNIILAMGNVAMMSYRMSTNSGFSRVGY